MGSRNELSSRRAFGTRRRYRLVDNAAVAQEDHPVGPRGELGVVGDDDRSDALLAGTENHPHHGVAVRRVKRTRRFVREEQMAFPYDRSCDRDALALASGQLIGVVGRSVGDTKFFELSHPCSVRSLCGQPVKLDRKCDVLHVGQAGQQVEVLEHVADRSAA